MRRKLTVIMALALAFVLVMGISTAFAAGLYDAAKDVTTKPGDTYPTYPGSGDSYGLDDKTKYSTKLTGREGKSIVYPPGFDPAAKYQNANKTGWQPLRKALADQTVHGQYKKNTNSCASCHMTHTAAGASLLFRNGIYNTCSACHDGSMDIYNVFADGDDLAAQLGNGLSADGKTTNGENMLTAGGGTFAGMSGASAHMATGDLALKAAPGGNRTATKGSWVGDFTCASCHAPHGSYSNRLLHYSPNKVGSTVPALGGFKYETKFTPNADAASVGDLVYKGGYYFIKKNAGVVTSKDDRNTTPWLYGYDLRTEDRWTSVVTKDANNKYNYKVIDGGLWDSKISVSWGQAYFKDPDGKFAAFVAAQTAAGKDTFFVVSPALKVNLTLSGQATDTGERKVTSYGAASAEINKFCAACHTDYNQKVDYTNDADGNVIAGAGLAQSNAGETQGLGIAATLRGTFTKGFRHNITERSANNRLPGNTNRMSCLTCHYAHGTTQEIMYDATNVLNTTKDLNPSSALKRYTNMAVCIRCHTSSHAITLKNNAGFWGTDDTVGKGEGYTIYQSHEGYGADSKGKW